MNDTLTLPPERLAEALEAATIACTHTRHFAADAAEATAASTTAAATALTAALTTATAAATALAAAAATALARAKAENKFDDGLATEALARLAWRNAEDAITTAAGADWDPYTGSIRVASTFAALANIAAQMTALARSTRPETPSHN